MSTPMMVKTMITQLQNRREQAETRHFWHMCERRQLQVLRDRKQSKTWNIIKQYLLLTIMVHVLLSSLHKENPSKRNQNNLLAIAKLEMSLLDTCRANVSVMFSHVHYQAQIRVRVAEGGALYLATTVPRMTFITVLSQRTLLSDTHTAPTMAQINSGK